MSGATTPVLRPPGPLTVIEASAGTGKTHVVASMVVTAIADGTPVHKILAVTFTRAATGELRERIWSRLVEVATQVRRHLATAAAATDDVAAEVCFGDADEIRARLDRLDRAIAGFDAATIATIHGFCDEVLRTVGYVSDNDRHPHFVEDLDDLVTEVVDDLLIQAGYDADAPLPFTRAVAMKIAREVTTNPTAQIVGVDGGSGDARVRRVRFAQAVRRRLDERKQRDRTMSFDDLLTRLEQALADDDRGTVRRRLRRRFSLVLVDEFQDTDNLQWSILRRGFVDDVAGADPVDLVLVGDPKQSIYAFRGADVHAYLAARDRSDVTAVPLTVNWRSDGDLLRGVDTVVRDATLGDARIRYQATTAVDHHQAPGLRTTHKPTAVRIRRVPLDLEPLTAAVNKAGTAFRQAELGRFIARDLATDISFRLHADGSSDAIDDRDRPGHRRALRPDDIAVLVPRHRDAALVQDALTAQGIPSVVNGTGSVLDGDGAEAWRVLLEAVETPAAATRVRRAVLGPFFSWTATDVAAADDRAWDAVHDDLFRWRVALAERGPLALYEQIVTDRDLPASLLARIGGERLLTDLAHVARLLHTRAADTDPSPTSLLAWLVDARNRPMRSADEAAQLRRLDTDAPAVQVWTIHRSKGLEYPIVYLPYLWRAQWIGDHADDLIPQFHAGDDATRWVDVAGGGPQFRRHRDAGIAELRGEARRLAYVAMTRARNQLVLWWAPGTSAPDAPLTQFLFGDPDEEWDRDRTLTAVPDDAFVVSRLGVLAQAADGALAVETVPNDVDTAGPWRPEPARDPDDARVRSFDRPLDRTWQRTSYSGLTAHAHALAAGTTPGDDAGAPEHTEAGIEDERLLDDAEDADAATPTPDGALTPDRVSDDRTEGAHGDGAPANFEDIAGGARFGTLLHEVLEHTDFTAADLDDAIARALADRPATMTGTLPPEPIVDGLVRAIHTPLGPLFDNRPLAALAPADRRDELQFEFALAGGDDPTGAVTLTAIADALADTLPADDPLATYPPALRSIDLDHTVRGYLSGSIDLVARVEGRYVVADYKSNRLGPPREPLLADDYHPAAMAEAMVRAHYPLQAVLYAVALHRFLRARLADYRPRDHLGGVAYLFLRGMVGDETPVVDGTPCGVFSWRPPAETVTTISNLLDEGIR